MNYFNYGNHGIYLKNILIHWIYFKIKYCFSITSKAQLSNLNNNEKYM